MYMKTRCAKQMYMYMNVHVYTCMKLLHSLLKGETVAKNFLPVSGLGSTGTWLCIILDADMIVRAHD